MGVSSNFLLRLDDARVKIHFARVQWRLRASDVSMLPPERQLARAHHLDTLRQYAARGVFPRNHAYNSLHPCFIDPDGRVCAVAHLLIASGHEDKAQEIARRSNYASVPEMPFPEIDAWAADNGLTRDEVALIQPAYPPTPDQLQFVQGIPIEAPRLLLALAVAGITGIAALGMSLWPRYKGRFKRYVPLAVFLSGLILLYIARRFALFWGDGLSLVVPGPHLSTPAVLLHDTTRPIFEAAIATMNSDVVVVGSVIARVLGLILAVMGGLMGGRLIYRHWRTGKDQAENNILGNAGS